MSTFELGAVIVGAAIIALLIGILVRLRPPGVTFQENLGISFDKDIPDVIPSNDPEISFDKDIPDDRP
jgi:hypothetical protein